VFEDAPLGIEAARRAGMRAVALATSESEELFEGHDHVIRICRDYRALALAELLRPM
jgi:beta-phosphoglucomutase